MSPGVDELLARAHSDLDAVRMLRDAGYGELAVSRSYYAAFYAAEAALLHVGESRSRHGGVVSAFGQFIVGQDGLDPSVGRALGRLFDLRNVADYDLARTSPEQVDRAVEQATRIVTAVTEWLER